MPDAPAQERLGSAETADFVGEHIHQFRLGIGSTVGQDPLELIPDGFVGVELGSICRKGHQVKTACAGE